MGRNDNPSACRATRAQAHETQDRKTVQAGNAPQHPEDEQDAGEIERQANLKASEIVKRTEEKARKLETDSEAMSKDIGEKLMSKRMGEAKKQSEQIKKKTEKSAVEMENRAKENMGNSVDDVVEAVIKRMKTLE